MDVLGLTTKLPILLFGSNSDDDFSDRLNYRYTVALLLLFAVILTTRQYASDVIIQIGFVLSYFLAFFKLLSNI